ncbi:MAG: DUF1836 domain-containing protein [Eubacteriales bacterium]|nr:DUF1836 domain-containing protein [Eubacteriales bacterium]
MQDRQSEFAVRLESFSPAPWEMIPDFGLYMDQVVTFVERQCRNLFIEGERVFTPAMVNNYVKFGLVDRPNGKKYGREQLAQLLMICVLKQSASADGMKALLKPPEGTTLQAHYESFCKTEREVLGALSEALPLPSAMTCAVQGAAYLFLCNALLFKKSQPTPRHANKQAPSTATSTGEDTANKTTAAVPDNAAEKI